MTTCSKCGRRWTGHTVEHCTGCHQSFTGTTTGDKHRVGRHDVTEGPDRRRCLTPEEMTKLGMVLNAAGLWSAVRPDDPNPWAKKPTVPSTASAGPILRPLEPSRVPQVPPDPARPSESVLPGPAHREEVMPDVQ